MLSAGWIFSIPAATDEISSARMDGAKNSDPDAVFLHRPLWRNMLRPKWLWCLGSDARRWRARCRAALPALNSSVFSPVANRSDPTAYDGREKCCSTVGPISTLVHTGIVPRQTRVEQCIGDLDIADTSPIALYSSREREK